MTHPQFLWSGFLVLMHVAGLLTILSAVLSKRSSQSSIAWVISCITFPYLAVPAYWLLGRDRFHGYVLARRSSRQETQALVGALREHAQDAARLADDFLAACRVFETLAAMPFTSGNRTDLLINGDAFFDRVFQEIECAADYILVQFFIVRDDALGRRLRDALAAKVRAGVRVYFLYDQIGSHALGKAFPESLRRAGIDVRAFRTAGTWVNRFQINFRNHRKIVLVDGRWAATGGANLGEEYCGRSKRFGYWRDTMIGVTGPAVQEIQLSFAEDWYFLGGEVPEMNWTPTGAGRPCTSILVLPTGPADEFHTCSMMFTQAIHLAETRLWITSPYFVPDQEIVRALQLAALRGVDVRILLPHQPDHLLVYWASFTYLEELERTGVRFYRYTKGLLHEKVLLVDDHLALVGTANTDNRSFYLNFELTLLVVDPRFAAEVEEMLVEDFRHGRSAGTDDFHRKPLPFRIAAHLARLLSPVL